MSTHTYALSILLFYLKSTAVFKVLYIYWYLIEISHLTKKQDCATKRHFLFCLGVCSNFFFRCQLPNHISDYSTKHLFNLDVPFVSPHLSHSDRDFSIQVSTERRSFTAGEPLELRCTIEAQNVPERFFSVSWVFSSSPVAVVGPSAVPVLGPDYVAREAAGHMTVRKESPNVHLLKLQHLRPEDAGKYICRVTEREKTPTGDFIDRSKRSRNVQITVQPLSE